MDDATVAVPAPTSPVAYPVSIKAVLFTADGSAVLLLNDRDEWELPGGRIELGESPEQCVARECAEELALPVRVGALLDSYLCEVVPGKHVFIVTYGCTLAAEFAPRISAEHRRIGLFPAGALPDNLPPGYHASILAWRRRLDAR